MMRLGYKTTDIVRLVTAFLLILSFTACNSEEGKVETVIVTGDKEGTIVQTEWQPQHPEQKADSRDQQKPRSTEQTPPRPEQSVPPKTAETAVAAKSAFHLQAGAFLHQNNALRLLEGLKQKGFQAHLVESTVQNKTWYLVNLGPYSQEKIARDTAVALASSAKIDVILMRESKLVKLFHRPTQSKSTPQPPSAKQNKKQPEKPEVPKQPDNPTKVDSTVTLSQPQNLKQEKQIEDDGVYPYSFQVGGLYTEENARKQLKRYQTKGYKPYIFKVKDKVSNDLWYTVRIGNYKTLKEAVDKASIFTAKEHLPTHPRPEPY